VQDAVAAAVVDRQRRGDALAHERDDELADRVVVGRVVRADHLGDGDGLRGAGLARTAALVDKRDACRRSEREPVVRGVVERERYLRDVDVGEAEAAPHDRVADLADRRAALDTRREADAEQRVVATPAIDRRCELDAIHAVPQHDLLPSPAVLERSLDDDPAADGRRFHRHVGRRVERRVRAPIRHQVPRSFGEVRVHRVLAIGEQLVAGAAGLHQLLARAPVEETRDSSSALRVDGHAIRFGLDRREALGGTPRGSVQRRSR
jgi:hypothetical protein